MQTRQINSVAPDPECGDSIKLDPPRRDMASEADCCATGPGLNQREDMDVFKCKAHVSHGDILNIRRTKSPLERLVAWVKEGKYPRPSPSKQEWSQNVQSPVRCLNLRPKEHTHTTRFATINFMCLYLMIGWHN
ncbi:hypothetical protein TNCV_2785391 [Trichonephila clavipes]|nr:hypothetical protein TNCV_2785391 [Trichonephila clavipes]